MELLAGQKRELLYQVCLDGKGKLLTCRCIAKGTVSASAVHVRQVVENALYAGASTIILAHNHPSGVALPSDADVLVTHRIQEALAPLGIRLADHHRGGRRLRLHGGERIFAEMKGGCYA